MLVEEYTKDYLGKVFYFSLKKTGNEEAAAELASNINYEILRSIDRGNKPDNFEAWVWAIARNQWAKWANKTYYKTPKQVDLQDYEDSLTSEDNVLETIAHSEDVDNLRRELAFIRTDYRQILVAHYFDEMSVATISKKLCIPLGTVKTKLISSRNLLKEGMNMAREFGEKSFKPETIGFSSSGYQPTGLPWSAVKRMIPMNILCVANNNPSTIEEISMELGIAMPYMEEEVELLEEAELLRKVEKGKYITNFFISPKECQNEMNELCCNYIEHAYEMIWSIAEKTVSMLKMQHMLNESISEEDVVAYWAFRTEQLLEHEVLPDEVFNFKRKDGGTWGFIGFECGAYSRLTMISFSDLGSRNDNVKWNSFQCDEYGFGQKQNYGARRYDINDIYDPVLETLREIVMKKNREDFSAGDLQHIKYLLRSGICVEKDGKLEVAVLVLTSIT